MTTQPVVSELEKRWLAGEITADDYFAQCRAIAEAEAKRHVASQQAGAKGKRGGKR